MEKNEQHSDLIKTARIAGIWYLVLAITGVLGFLVVHPQIFVSEDPEQTLTNRAESETLIFVIINLPEAAFRMTRPYSAAPSILHPPSFILHPSSFNLKSKI